ncbi:hypothetical protein EJB05_38193, partial [Eragrostis curvula]
MASLPKKLPSKKPRPGGMMILPPWDSAKLEGAVSGRGAGAPTAGEDGKGTASRCGRSWPAHRLPWRLGDVALGRGGVTRQGAASGRRRKVWRDASRSAPRSPHPVRPLLPLVPKSQPTSFQPFLPPPQQALMLTHKWYWANYRWGLS